MDIALVFGHGKNTWSQEKFKYGLLKIHIIRQTLHMKYKTQDAAF